MSPDVAIGGFHANSGSLLVCLVSLGLGWAAHRLAFFSTTTARPTTRFTADPTAAHLAPLVAITLTAMATGAATRGGFDVLYGARVLVAAAVLWVFREAYDARGWTWRDAWPAAGTGVGAFVLWLALALATPAHAGDPVADGVAALAAPERGVWLAVRLLGAVVAAPIAEELAFRGYLARRLAGRDFTAVDPTKLGWLAIATSSLLFGLMHDRVVAGTAAGVLYALAYRRRGSLGDAVVAHATTNLLLVSVVLATGRWSLW